MNEARPGQLTHDRRRHPDPRAAGRGQRARRRAGRRPSWTSDGLVDRRARRSTTRRASSPRWTSSRRDIIMSDLSMPGFSGYRALELRARSDDRILPFIFVSGTMGEEAAVEALRSGATDYVLKHNLARLASRRAPRAARGATSARRAHAPKKSLMRAQRYESLALLASAASATICATCCSRSRWARRCLQDDQRRARCARSAQLVRDCAQRGLDIVHVDAVVRARRARAREQRASVARCSRRSACCCAAACRATVDAGASSIDGPRHRVRGNYTELQQCLLNLCLNARAGDAGRRRSARRRDPQPSSSANFFAAGEAAAPGALPEDR